MEKQVESILAYSIRFHKIFWRLLWTFWNSGPSSYKTLDFYTLYYLPIVPRHTHFYCVWVFNNGKRDSWFNDSLYASVIIKSLSLIRLNCVCYYNKLDWCCIRLPVALRFYCVTTTIGNNWEQLFHGPISVTQKGC